MSPIRSSYATQIILRDPLFQQIMMQNDSDDEGAGTSKVTVCLDKNESVPPKTLQSHTSRPRGWSTSPSILSPDPILWFELTDHLGCSLAIAPSCQIHPSLTSLCQHRSSFMGSSTALAGEFPHCRLMHLQDRRSNASTGNHSIHSNHGCRPSRLSCSGITQTRQVGRKPTLLATPGTVLACCLLKPHFPNSPAPLPPLHLCDIS